MLQTHADFHGHEVNLSSDAEVETLSYFKGSLRHLHYKS